MAFLGRGQSSGCSNPVLTLFTPIGGVLFDVDSLEYVISENVTTPGTPVQVFPVAGRAPVDVTQACPDGGRLGIGHYVADWAVPATQLPGEHIIQFFFRLTPTSPEQTFSYTFEVLPVMGAGAFLYATLAKVRAEGLTVTAADDTAVLNALALAAAYIDKVTGRHFLPAAKQICLDGNCARGLMLDEPIIAVSEVRVDCCGDDLTSGSRIDPSCYRVYNRHISKNLKHPDDRENPRIEFCAPFYDGVHGSGGETWRPLNPLYGNRWPAGRQNIIISGVFGYTDCDGGPTGKTPDLICRAAVLLACRFLPSKGSAGAASLKWNATFGQRIKREKTADQEYELFSPAQFSGTGRGGGAFTGDPEIDTILAMYKRHPLIGAV